ncbi:MAG TPA: alpha/beta hydrolase-fold protein [Flavobacteriaceae bacterium]|nr:alpha/beta hydrolase-fold protein [Flavobacteriaceae bacterium]
MKSCIFFILLIAIPSYSQTIYKTVQSVNLKETRKFKVQLPRDFEENPDKTYPLVLVLDGDYLFEPVAGNVDYCAYWDEMPQSVVVGVNQANFRAADNAFDEIRNVPMQSCRDFYAFLKSELMPFLVENYRINDFKIIVAQGISANLANIFLINDPEMFDAFINLSPIFTPNMKQNILAPLKLIEDKKWYYVAMASQDWDAVKRNVEGFDVDLSLLDRPNIFYHYDVIPNQTHYSMVTDAIPNGLEAVFSTYGPIDPVEYETEVLPASSPCEYLEKKYETIKELYGWQAKLKKSDILAVSSAIEANKKWDDFKKLSKLAKKNFPETVMEDYFMARYYEENGKEKKAYRYFQNAYPKEEVGFLTRDYLWKYITKLKTEYGF